jgi:hypothetical protein
MTRALDKAGPLLLTVASQCKHLWDTTLLTACLGSASVAVRGFAGCTRRRLLRDLIRHALDPIGEDLAKAPHGVFWFPPLVLRCF